MMDDSVNPGSSLGMAEFLWEVLTLLLLDCCGESPRHNPALDTVCAIRAAQLVLGVVNDVTRQSGITTLEAADVGIRSPQFRDAFLACQPGGRRI